MIKRVGIKVSSLSLARVTDKVNEIVDEPWTNQWQPSGHSAICLRPAKRWAAALWQSAGQLRDLSPSAFHPKKRMVRRSI